MAILRDYQSEAIRRITDALARNRSTLCVMPTGTGKTEVFSTIAQQWPAGRIMVIAHRDELVRQMVERMWRVCGTACGVEKAQDKADGERIIAASVQTLNSPWGECSLCQGRGCQACLAGMRFRMMRFPPPDFSLVVFDEAHHSTATTYRRVADWFARNPQCKILGVTATPNRADEAALSQVYQSVAYEYWLADAIRDGWLVPIRQVYIEIAGLDLSQCRVTGGDLNLGDVAAATSPAHVITGYADAILETCGNMKTLVFAPPRRARKQDDDESVPWEDNEPIGADATELRPGEAITEALNRKAGHAVAQFIRHGMPQDERRALVASFRRSDFRYLVNVGITTEGFDVPDIEAVAMCRPTLSAPLYQQMIGRGTRPLPGVVDDMPDAESRRQAIAASAKRHILVVDFVGNSGRHSLVSSVDVLGGKYTDEAIRRARRIIAKEPMDPLDALAKAERQIAEAQRIALLRHAKATINVREVDPFALFNVVPVRIPAWHRDRKATPKQLDLIRRNGVEVPDDMNFARASQLCDAIVERIKNKLCTVKQAKLLARFGYDPDLSFNAARKVIDALAANGWRRPS